MSAAAVLDRERRHSGIVRMFSVTAAQSAIAACAQLVLMGLAARGLTHAEFDHFTAFATIGVWLTLTDLGLNKALLTELKRGAVKAADLRSTALTLQAICAGVLLVPVVFLAPPPARLAAAILLAVAPLSAARAALVADQRGWIPAAWDLAGGIVTLALCAFAAPHSGLMEMTLLAASGLVTSRLCGAFWLREWPAFSASAARPLWQGGRHFLLAQLADLILLQGLPWVAIAVLPVGEAGAFCAAARLTALVPLALGMLANAMLPAYAHAMGRGDAAWIDHTLRRSVSGGLVLVTVAAAGLSAAWPRVLSVWLGPNVPQISQPAWLGLVGVAALQGAMAPVLSFFYGTGSVRHVSHWTLAAALSGLAAGAWAGSRWGAPGMAAALVCSQVLLMALPLTVRLRGRSRCVSL